LSAQPPLLRSKFFWVALLYFAEGFPLGIFYEIFPVYFRQQGVELRSIGTLSLLGLAWTLKFLWAPAIDRFRRHRVWMAAADLGMGAVMIAFAAAAGLPHWVWAAIALFALLSATNDIAIDGYTIELLHRDEMGRGNGLRIGFYRAGMITSGLVLMASDLLGWRGAFVCAAALFALCAAFCLLAPPERMRLRTASAGLGQELRAFLAQRHGAAAIVMVCLGTLWLVDGALAFSAKRPWLWPAFTAAAALAYGLLRLAARPPAAGSAGEAPTGALFGALADMMQRPGVLPVLTFVLTFKLGDASMGFMVKPFWVDAGFSAAQIGLVSVNIGLVLSIAGGLVGGWYADRVGIFKALWVLGLAQAFSNLGYALAAWLIPLGGVPQPGQRLLLYAASMTESFTGGLGTAAFLAFLMAIVRREHGAAEYALLSSIFAASRSVAGWAGGLGAQAMGYAPYFLFTFFLAFPAYLLLPWVRRMLEAQSGEERPSPPG
jgi:PAT family beta-lactamase induction signal transducer AmpG